MNVTDIPCYISMYTYGKEDINEYKQVHRNVLNSALVMINLIHIVKPWMDHLML